MLFAFLIIIFYVVFKFISTNYTPIVSHYFLFFIECCFINVTFLYVIVNGNAGNS